MYFSRSVSHPIHGSPTSPYSGSQSPGVYSPVSTFPSSPDGSISAPSSPYSLPADTPPPAYMPPDGEKENDAMDTTRPPAIPPVARNGKLLDRSYSTPATFCYVFTKAHQKPLEYIISYSITDNVIIILFYPLNKN